MALKYLADLPYADDIEVRAAALRLFLNARADLGDGGGEKRGNATLLHAEQVAIRLMHSMVLATGPGEDTIVLARIYAKTASLLGMMAYFSGMAQNTVTVRSCVALARKAAS